MEVYHALCELGLLRGTDGGGVLDFVEGHSCFGSCFALPSLAVCLWVESGSGSSDIVHLGTR